MSGEVPRPMWGWSSESEEVKKSHSYCRILFFLLEFPFSLQWWPFLWLKRRDGPECCVSTSSLGFPLEFSGNPSLWNWRMCICYCRDFGFDIGNSCFIYNEGKAPTSYIFVPFGCRRVHDDHCVVLHNCQWVGGSIGCIAIQPLSTSLLALIVLCWGNSLGWFDIKYCIGIEWSWWSVDCHVRFLCRVDVQYTFWIGDALGVRVLDEPTLLHNSKGC